jgi:hypothetical protein
VIPALPVPLDVGGDTKTLCALATLSFALGEYDRCADSVDAAGELLREREVSRASITRTRCAS